MVNYHTSAYHLKSAKNYWRYGWRSLAIRELRLAFGFWISGH